MKLKKGYEILYSFYSISSIVIDSQNYLRIFFQRVLVGLITLRKNREVFGKNQKSDFHDRRNGYVLESGYYLPDFHFSWML